MDKNIGKRLDGRYEITELIGIGGMADVYKAMDIVDNKVVAVKILKNEFADNDDFVRRFRNESKAIAVLSHPNIVKIYDVGFTEKMQFIVMEYIDGITLKEFIEQQGMLKWKDAVYFIVQILRALQHAHDRGIVHRDIKPQNIMLFPDGTIKVMDFGIARFAREEGKTLSDKAIGSVHYISPEQARGDVTDEKSDIYSVGIMLYEMLTGRKPFDADTPVAVALMHMQNKARPPRYYNDTIPEGLEEIVMRAMQKEPSGRYPSASEMIKDIEEFRKNPSIVFEYNLESTPPPRKRIQPADNEKTQAFDRSGVRSTVGVSNGGGTRMQRKPVKKAIPDYDEEDYEEYDDDEESVSKSSYFIVTLTAIAAAVVIVVVVFIALKVVDIFNITPPPVDVMPSLVGVNYQDAKTTYAEYFDMTVDSQEYSSEYDSGVIIRQVPKAGAEFIVKNTNVQVVVSKGPRMVTVTNVYDQESNTAQSLLKQQGFNVSIMFQISDVEKDTVIKTEPERNESIEYGSTVIMYVSQGPEIQDVIMTDVTGLYYDEAEALLTGKGLKVSYERQDSAADKDVVLSQSIPAVDDAGDPNVLTPGTEIVLTISSGVPPASPANITFAVPSDVEGPGTFRAYINGNIVGKVDVDNVGYVSTITITVEGSKLQTVNIEAVNTKSGISGKIGEYAVDFTEGTVTEMSMNRDRFVDIFTYVETTTTTEEIPEETEETSEYQPQETSAPEETGRRRSEETTDDGFSDDDIPEVSVLPSEDIIDSSEDEGWWDEIFN